MADETLRGLSAPQSRIQALAQRSGRRPRRQNAPENIIAARVKTKVWLEVDGRFVAGDGGLYLLRGIEQHGSLSAAVREIGWSYRHAWGYLRRAEEALGTPLTRPRPGKGATRGSVLTEYGRLLLQRLVELRGRVDEAIGPSGPTASDVAARDRSSHAPRGRRRPGQP